MRKKWSKEEEDFIRNNISSMSINDFVKYFDTEYAKIIDKIHKMGLNSKKSRNIIWSKEEDMLLSNHFEYAPKDYLMKMFPRRTWKGILQRGLKTLKLNRKSQDRIFVNYMYFNSWSNEMSYILGFIMADGHVHLGNDNYLQIEVKEDSLDILNKIASAINFEGKIYRMKKRNSYKLQIKNIKIIKDIISHGVTNNNKSHLATFPIDIPAKYIKDFIRGLIDGDGWSRIDSDGIYNIGLCGTKDIVSKTKDLLNVDCSTNNVSHYEENCWRFNIKGKKALKIASWIYDDATIYLDRKYNTYKEALNHYSPS